MTEGLLRPLCYALTTPHPGTLPQGERGWLGITGFISSRMAAWGLSVSGGGGMMASTGAIA